MYSRYRMKYLTKIAAVFLLAISFIECSEDDDYLKNIEVGGDAPRVIAIATDKPTIPADGVSTMKLTISLLKQADTNGLEIDLFTTMGTFENGEQTIKVKPQTDGVAIAFLRSGDSVGEGILKAVVRGYSVSKSFATLSSPPTIIQLQPGAMQDGQIPLDAKLYSAKGQISRDFAVAFTLVPDTLPAPVFFTPIVDINDGTASTTIHKIGNFTGTVRVRASVRLDGATVNGLSSEVDLMFK